MNAMTNFRKTWMWVVGTQVLPNSTYVVCCHRICIFSTPLHNLFWLANNKKVKYPEFCMCYSDKTGYVGNGGQKLYQHGLSSQNAHI